MLRVQERVPLGPKTTMRIGGLAQYYAELSTEDDIAEAMRFAAANDIPLIALGGGSNTVFSDDLVRALVVRVKSGETRIERDRVTVRAGKILASLIAELAGEGLDLSALAGIPGTLGGALFGNAGQGLQGVWIGSFIESVTANVGGAWRTFTRGECRYRYRESAFKDIADARGAEGRGPPPVILWGATLRIPLRPRAEIEAEIAHLLRRRSETQPHLKTAGSCFKALPDGTPAWKLIAAAGLRGRRRGDVQISEKHANFLLNTGRATFADALALTRDIRREVPGIAGVEMRFFGSDGRIAA